VIRALQLRRLDLRLTERENRRVVLVALVALGTIAIVVAVASRTDRQFTAVALAAALLILLLSIRWPLLPLFGYVVLIPIEEAVVIGDLGTLSRYAAILFVIVYAIPRLGRLTIRTMPLAGWGYVAWAIFSATWAIDLTAASTEIPVLILLFIVAIVIGAVVVERPSIVRPLLWAYSLSAAATACVGVIAYLQGGGPLGPEDRIAAIQDQNPAYYAAILLPALVFALYELVNGRRLFVSFGVMLVCTAAILASGTRGAWLGAAVVFVLFLLPRLDPARRAAAAGIVLALLVITIQLPGLSTLVQQRTDIALSSGGSGRTDIWSVGLSIYESAPVTGVGLGNFPVAFTPERVRDVAVEIITDPKTLTNRAPHNIVISTLGELGLVGLLLLGVFLGPLLIRRGWGSEAAAVQAALASLLVLALFLDILNRKQLWLLIGIACGLAYIARRLRLESAETATEGPGGHQATGSPFTVPGPNT
jgi:O-antigen ligase